MKGDFTRRTFRSEHHYRGVLLQQGRVQLDADWNEQVDIADHLRRAAIRDTLGAHGAPADTAGLAVTCGDGDIGPADEPMISAGRYYVDGILCENEAPIKLSEQPDYHVPNPDAPGEYLAYLDVWTEHLTALERPNLREVALRGPDTATRARTVWQMRLHALDKGQTVTEPWLPDVVASTGQMRARTESTSTETTDPCVVPDAAGYRKLENQLYRVEIHRISRSVRATPGDGGEGAAQSRPASIVGNDQEIRYLWAQDNASVVARPVSVKAADTGSDVLVTLGAPARDERLAFGVGYWLEITDEDRVHRNEPGFVGQISQANEQGDQIRLHVTKWVDDGPLAALAGVDPGRLLVRRWNGHGSVPFGSGATVEQEQWFALNDPNGDQTGIQIEFQSGCYNTGDYWLIPARAAILTGSNADPYLIGDIDWPRDDNGIALFQPAEGIHHAYAPIARLSRSEDGWMVEEDHRRIFPPLAELTQVAYAGGDGQEAMPGEALPQPLQVSVLNCWAPVTGAQVQFKITLGGGRLARTQDGLDKATDTTITISTRDDGIAACYWKLGDVEDSGQCVTASLLGPDGSPAGPRIDFSANLSVADGVWFDPADCPALAGAGDVQQAVQRLAKVRSLVALGGDGQDGLPDAELKRPVEVLVRTDGGGAREVEVYFTVETGSVSGVPASPTLPAVDTTIMTTTAVKTDDQGVATCCWTLGKTDSPVQVLTASLVDPSTSPGSSDVLDVEPKTVKFTANVRDASLVPFDTDSGPLAGASTVQAALDQLVAVRSLVALGGDGQDGLPDAELKRPVEVLVRTDGGPVESATVHFAVETEPGPDGGEPVGIGSVHASTGAAESWIDVPTANGVATCHWTLGGADHPVQVLTASLPLTAGAVDVEPKTLKFTANVSDARLVGFAASEGPLKDLLTKDRHNAYDAIQWLAMARSLEILSGDKQWAQPGNKLPGPVEVTVRSSYGTVAGVQVTFVAPPGQVRGDDKDKWQDSVTLTTDVNGTASCQWLLGPGAVPQTLTASLLKNDPYALPPGTVTFTTAERSGMVTEVSSVGEERPISRGSSLEPTHLMDGVRFRLDAPLASSPGEAGEGGPEVTLTLDLPHPLSSADRVLVGDDILGTVPLTLAGEVVLDPDDSLALMWTMTPAAHAFVANRLFPLLSEANIGRVRCHLSLTERLGAGPSADLCTGLGTALRDDLRTGTGTGVGVNTSGVGHGTTSGGAGFTRSFWLVPTVTSLVIVPRRNELFRLKTVRDALDLATPRDALRAALPGDVRLADHAEVDLAAARRAAERGLRGGAARPMVLVVDERYTAAAEVVRDALVSVNLPVEITSAQDPASWAGALIEAEEPFDGILTDSTALSAIADLGGFAEAIHL